MKNIVYILLFGTFSGLAQTDYNTQKGFVAEGYDVVSYFENNSEKGKKEYMITYEDVKYKFVSQEHLNAFNKNPKKYIPQYGGYCAYAIALKSKKVKIDPETFEIRDDKLYLFYNSWGINTLDLWKKENVKGLIEKGDQNWEALKKKN